jgi:hypothetical protein
VEFEYASVYLVVDVDVVVGIDGHAGWRIELTVRLARSAGSRTGLTEDDICGGIVAVQRPVVFDYAVVEAIRNPEIPASVDGEARSGA